jgi:hypothetical protein
MFIGDFNYDMLVSDKSTELRNVCAIFDLINLVKKSNLLCIPTCRKSLTNLSHNVVHLALSGSRTHNINGNRHRLLR